MAFPAAPDFTASGDADAWWITRFTNTDGSAGVALCTTNGRSFVTALQLQLGLTPDGKWGPATSAALITALQGSGASAVLTGGVQADAGLRQVSVNSVRAAIYLVQLTGQTLGDAIPSVTEDGIGVLPSAIPPRWDTASSFGPGGQISPTCSLQGAAATAAVTNAGPPITTDANGNPVTTPSPSPAPGTAPLSTDPQAVADSVALGLPPGVLTGPVAQSGSSISGPVVLFVAGMVVIVGLFAYDVVTGSLKEEKRPSLSPARARRSSRRSYGRVSRSSRYR